MQRYRQLKVWKKAHENFLQILALDGKLLQRQAAWMVFKQLIRAASSVGANIAEGHGRQLPQSRHKDYLNFLEIALGSANETDYWLIVMRDAGLVPTVSIESLIAMNEEVLRMLYVLIRETQHRRSPMLSTIG